LLVAQVSTFLYSYHLLGNLLFTQVKLNAILKYIM
jgi:hypothetical protein